jgi:hypothetical protein
MVTHDPNRTPNFVLFGNPDYFLSASGHTTPLCMPATDSASCFVQSRNFAWNHGDFQHEIVRTWLGIVGPGIRNLGLTDQLFTDHTDIRPTILALTQLKDDYTHDGRVLFEIINDNALPQPLRGHSQTLSEVAEIYKTINAPTGILGIATLTSLATPALAGDNATYTALENKITDLTNRRNQISGDIIGMLEAAEFQGQQIDENAAKTLVNEAEGVLGSVSSISQ